MYHGMINVYKEKGFTSHDVVAKLRGICKQKKIGHTGTLDPDAVGVLPVCLGCATRLCDMLTEKDKEYVAVLRLGVTTDTQDITGKVLAEKEVTESVEKVREVISSFEGEQLQIPPMYSALKVNGKKLYELAREGKEIERKARPIVVHEIEILSENMPEFTIRIKCSKGTYIRTICHDIGQKLSCGGAMVSLKRTKVGNFGIEDSYTLSRIEDMAKEGRLCEILLPVEKVFEKLPEIRVKEETMKALLNGNQLRREDFLSLSEEALKAEEVRVYGSDGRFYGVYGYQEGRKLFCPIKMFFPEQAER
ncbi:MAG: tRNA pseudouridine(55) synthase TruB [Lachnospiraceae bacterium]|nr:tRNA pseudouridine(55) synthase TruB [Lachnospiraceae bacterium]MDD7626839.1 tRNA pseudouridine(55) synthase TruB [Lachnospiraceae bacterium]MDY4118558.1 tRNA pseudouridine(55) synthase TruB [Lachnospiraceae bacterium]